MTRIVRCPGCKELLVEPSTPIYECGQCSMVLHAKYAIQQLQQQEQARAEKRDQSQEQQQHQERESPAPRMDQNFSGEQKQEEGMLQDVRKLAQDAFSAAGAAAVPRFSSASGAEDLSGGLNSIPRWKDIETVNEPERKQLQQDEKEEAEQDAESEFAFQTTGPTSDYEPVDHDFYSTRSEVSEIEDSRDEKLAGSGAGKKIETQSWEGLAKNREVAVEDRLAIVREEGEKIEEDRLQLEKKVRDEARRVSSAESSFSDKTAGSPAQVKAYPRLGWPYVVCQHCKQLLEVPRNLPPSKRGVQKLRCGACLKISKFQAANSTYHPAKLQLVPVNRDFSFSSTSSSPASSRDNFALTKPYYLNGANGVSRKVFPSEQHESPRTENQKMKTPEEGLQLVAVRPRPQQPSFDLSFESSTSRGSQSSAPASFQHGTGPSSVRKPGRGKGYESAPEFLGSHSQRPSSSSHDTGPPQTTSPCLHELFGYESASEFLMNQLELQQQRSRSDKRGIRAIFSKAIHVHHDRVPSNRVSVNGHHIPEVLVRKAENKAGPIYPGSYWYDSQAGFWGVMGGPCLGIIPPCIEQFNYPMPIHCSGGKTGIIVNGRELHHKDLEKLVQRGLPSTTDRSYSLHIDGTVIDLASETELQCLGRLAPTIEQRKVGYGMFPLSRA